MKNVIIFLISLIILCTFPVVVFADPVADETTTQHEIVASSDPEHSHTWDVVAFDATYNVVTLKCSECQLVETLDFAECLTNFTANNEYFSAVDVNHDGVINGRDYSYLVRGFTNLLQTDAFINMFSSKEFLYKEMFLYIYLTILFVVSTGFICISIKRYQK